MVKPHFVLVHSPLVTKETWRSLALSFARAGYPVTTVALDNALGQGETYYQHHLALIESALVGLAEQRQRVVAVGHSGAGSLLALLNPEQIAAYVFLDAAFPLADSSRFALFDDPAAVQSWRALAERHAGMLPRQMLVGFGEQIANDDARAALVASIDDVPIALYEELIPVHSQWPPMRPGLYIQWTPSYTQDAARASGAGFTVCNDFGSHFKMLDAPDDLAQMIIASNACLS